MVEISRDEEHENPHLDELARQYNGPCPLCQQVDLVIAADQEVECPHCHAIAQAYWVKPRKGYGYLHIEYKRGQDA